MKFKECIPGREVNLEGINLSGTDLSNADLRGRLLCRANLRKADLRGADLHEANLRGANLRGANLRGANLSFANLSEADLEGADLCEANLYGAVGPFSQFSFRQHTAIYAGGNISIGYIVYPIDYWREHYIEIFEGLGYTDEEIQAYGAWIEMMVELS